MNERASHVHAIIGLAPGEAETKVDKSQVREVVAVCLGRAAEDEVVLRGRRRRRRRRSRL